MVKDWECMTDLLIEEAGPTEEALDNKQESTLIEIMVSAVRQCSTGEPPIGRGTSRKMVSPIGIRDQCTQISHLSFSYL